MAIFICSNCSHTEETPDEFIGKKARCLNCQTLGTITEKTKQSPLTPLHTPGPQQPAVLDADEFVTEKPTSNKKYFSRNDRELWFAIILFVLLGGILTAQLVDLDGLKQWEYAIHSPDDSGLDDRLELLGNQGWELVFARRASSSSGAGYEMIFRRPK